MQVSTSNMPAFWLSICLLITTALGSFPSLMPRHGFAINAVHNHKHSPNGVAAKAKAINKFAHLVESNNVKISDYDPCELHLASASNLLSTSANRSLQLPLSVVLLRTTIESGCALLRLAHLLSQSTWTWILALLICKCLLGPTCDLSMLYLSSHSKC